MWSGRSTQKCDLLKYNVFLIIKFESMKLSFASHKLNTENFLRVKLMQTPWCTGRRKSTHFKAAAARRTEYGYGAKQQESLARGFFFGKKLVPRETVWGTLVFGTHCRWQKHCQGVLHEFRFFDFVMVVPAQLWLCYLNTLTSNFLPTPHSFAFQRSLRDFFMNSSMS